MGRDSLYFLTTHLTFMLLPFPIHSSHLTFSLSPHPHIHTKHTHSLPHHSPHKTLTPYLTTPAPIHATKHALTLINTHLPPPSPSPKIHKTCYLLLQIQIIDRSVVYGQEGGSHHCPSLAQPQSVARLLGRAGAGCLLPAESFAQPWGAMAFPCSTWTAS